MVVCLMLAGTVSAEQEAPRVLLLGDDVYYHVNRGLGKHLKDRARVTWKKPGDTSSALEDLDEMLGEEKWDVIHFNFGFADLHYKDPSTKEVRAMSKDAGGVRVTAPQQYEKNLEELVKRLKATGAKLVWASTTPILNPQPVESLYDIGSEIEYNAIAARVMARHGVPINDMHSFVLEQIDPERPPGILDFRGIDLVTPVAKAIQAKL